MKLCTKYHGVIEYDEETVINLKKGIPGFNSLTKFIIAPIQENPIFSLLQSIEELEIAFVTISPFDLMKKYEFNLDEEIVTELKIESEEDVLVLATVCMNSDIKKITANLKAPIIINTKQRIGQQLILDNEKYLVKYPLFKEE